MTEVKVRLSKDGPFEINEELAGLVPMADEIEQAVLTRDIAENQQQDPIVLWQGKVIDGRCRQKALVMLGSHIMYRELDDNLTEEEVRVYVKSVNTRRNLTHTQKVMSAVRESLRKNSKSNSVIAKAWGISECLLKNGKFIAKHRPEYVQPLFDGHSINITSSEGYDTTSNKISTIYAAVKRELDAAEENEEHAWSEDSAIKTQAGKEWYYEFVKVNKVSDIPVRIALVELANHKFVKGKKYNEKK